MFQKKCFGVRLLLHCDCYSKKTAAGLRFTIIY